MRVHNSRKSVKEYIYTTVTFALGMHFWSLLTIPTYGTFVPAAGTGAFGDDTYWEMALQDSTSWAPAANRHSAHKPDQSCSEVKHSIPALSFSSFLLAYGVPGYVCNISVRILFHQWLRAMHGPAEAVLAIKLQKSYAVQWCCFRGCPTWYTWFNTSTLNKIKTRVHLQL